MVRVMLVTIPKKFEVIISSLQHAGYRRETEAPETITLRGGFDITIGRREMNMTREEFKELATKMKVKNGRKIVRPKYITLKSYKTRYVGLKLSEEEYETVKEMANSKGMKISDFIRDLIFKTVIEGL